MNARVRSRQVAADGGDGGIGELADSDIVNVRCLDAAGHQTAGPELEEVARGVGIFVGNGRDVPQDGNGSGRTGYRHGGELILEAAHFKEFLPVAAQNGQTAANDAASHRGRRTT